jgi:hypothetical protein
MRNCLLGAVNGVLFCGAAWLVSLLIQYLQRTRNQEKQDPSLSINLASVQEKWLGAVFLLVCIFVIVSFVVGHYWRKSPKHPVVTWVLIGIGAITTWNLVILAVALWERFSNEQTLPLEAFTNPRNPLHGLMSFGLVVVLNLVYGMIVGLIFVRR